MATGLDRIIERIRTEAEARAAEKIAEAKAEAETVLADAEKQAEEKAAEILEAGKRTAEEAAVRAESSGEFARRRALLAAKQNAIRTAVGEARERLHTLDDEAYFAVLLGLLRKNAAPGRAALRLSARDLARMPQNFAAEAAAAVPGAEIEVSQTPADIADGFLLQYDGIDVNCTFDSLFAEKADALQDIAGGVLFQ